jgi:hypothetical protein
MIELKIYQYNVSGQVVKVFDVDLYDNAPINVNKSIVDIKEPEQRKSDYTLSIQIPATATNRKTFSEIDNLNRTTINDSARNFNPDFNPNLKAEAIVLNNGVEQMRGYLQLTQIPINDKSIDYEIIIIGKLANLFQDLGDSQLTDLDLSEFDHTWNSTNVANSWATYIVKNGGIYNNFNVSGNPNGEGYVYPLIDNGASVNFQEIEYWLKYSMFPSIYVKQLVDSIFQGQGYRYESNFFNSIEFKRLIIPFSNGQFIMTEQEVEDRTWDVSNSSTLNYVVTGTPFPPVVSDLKIFNFNTILQDTTPPSVSLANDWVEIASGNNGNYRVGLQGNVLARNVSGATITQNLQLLIDLKRVRGSTIVSTGVTVDFEFVSTPNNGTVTKAVNWGSIEFDAQVGDKFSIEFLWLNTIRDASDFEIDFLPNFGYYSSPSSTYSEGQTISLNSALPQEVKQAEFLSWLIKLFNLYIVSDKIDPKKLIIEPRDDFYTNEIVDLTNYLDTSKELVIKPMGVLDFRKLELSYKADSDEYNKKYQNLFREPYATKKYDVVNDFLTQTKKVQVGFSATPLANSSTHDRVQSVIRNEEFLTQDSDLPAFNIRILYYGGLVNTSTGWRMRTDAGVISYTDFPYAGMLDSVSNPTKDLGWAQPKAINYGLGLTIYTNGNLFNRFWKKTIEEITDKDSKLITGYFHLTENRFQNLDFRKYYLIDKQYYRLYNVSKNLTSNDPCELEFLKLKVAPSFVLESGTGNGGSGGSIGNESLPMFTRKDNSILFNSELKTQTKTQELSGGNDYFLNYSEDVSFIEDLSDVILPDATIELLGSIKPIVRIKNICGSTVKIYPLKASQLVNGATFQNLPNFSVITLIAYKGNWQTLNIIATGGG